MARYHVRFIHKISPHPSDVAESVEIPDGAFSDRKSLRTALHNLTIAKPFYPGMVRVLMSGERIVSYRVEADRVTVFLSGSMWHSIILTHEGN